MSTSTLIYLRPGDRIEAHDGPGAPYLTITPDDYRSSVVLFLGDPLAPDELAAARRQLDQLEAAVSRARYLIAHHTEGPEPGPDDPTDDPTDDPVVPASAMLEAAMDATLAEVGYHAPDARAQALDARRDAILDGSAPAWTDRGRLTLEGAEHLLAGVRPLDEAPETESELRAAWGDR